MATELADTPAEAAEHVVHFYADDYELSRTVGAFLADAVALRAPAVVIATEAHLEAFVAALEATGLEPDRALEDGSLVFLDAAATLGRFTTDGGIDPEAFRQVVGEILREASQAGPGRVRAYGEMVALLWESGDVLGAIELERLWNELGQELEFTLLCGYHSESVSLPEQAGALEQVCHLHSSVSPSGANRERSGEFPAEPDSPGSARHFAVEALRSCGLEGVTLDDAQLVLSELATNAVIHARTPFSVTISATASRVRMAVRDASPVRPIMRDDDPMALSGRGLHLVDKLAVDWGVEIAADGKTVWATFAA